MVTDNITMTLAVALGAGTVLNIATWRALAAARHALRMSEEARGLIRTALIEMIQTTPRRDRKTGRYMKKGR